MVDVAGQFAVNYGNEAARLEEAIDGPSRAGAAARASILQDSNEARLFLRYQAEARGSFHRAYKELKKALKDDAEAAEEATKTIMVRKDKPPSPVSDPAPAVSPNEPSEGSEEGAESEPSGPPNEPSRPVTAGSPNEPSLAAGPVTADPVVSPNEPSAAGLAEVLTLFGMTAEE